MADFNSPVMKRQGRIQEFERVIFGGFRRISRDFGRFQIWEGDKFQKRTKTPAK